MDLREVAAAYQSIYLKEEVEETILLEDLSQDEVDDLVEEIIDEFLEEGFLWSKLKRDSRIIFPKSLKFLMKREEQKEEHGKSYDEVKAEIDAKEAAKKAKVDKSETSKAAKVVRPSDKIAASAKKAVEKRKDTTGTTSGAGAQGTVRSKDGSMGAEGKKGTALPPAKRRWCNDQER